MTIETDHDLQQLKHIGQIVARCLKAMRQKAEPGMTTAELDAVGASFLEQHGARSAPKISYDFPGATCISLNEQAAHGIPGPRIIKAGDMVNVDVSAEKNGYFADTGGSFIIPPVDQKKQRLILATKQALNSAIDSARAGNPINRIGLAIERVAKKKGYRIIKNLCSHGVGKSLHEDPKEIPGYYCPEDKRKLWDGAVITIEPFLSTLSEEVHEDVDGWTLIAAPGNLSAQFEHSMVITRGKPILLTLA